MPDKMSKRLPRNSTFKLYSCLSALCTCPNCGFLNADRGNDMHPSPCTLTALLLGWTWYADGSDDTVEPVLKDRPIGHKNMVSQDRWSLVTVSELHWNVRPARSMWSFKTGGLSWQWSLQTYFTGLKPRNTDHIISGDVLGPSLHNLGKLLQLPQDCGEQNMASFAPNIFILNYLQRTKQLKPKIQQQAINLLMKGLSTVCGHVYYGGGCVSCWCVEF